jgi:hypothetical protein
MVETGQYRHRVRERIGSPRSRTLILYCLLWVNRAVLPRAVTLRFTSNSGHVAATQLTDAFQPDAICRTPFARADHRAVKREIPTYFTSGQPPSLIGRKAWAAGIVSIRL